MIVSISLDRFGFLLEVYTENQVVEEQNEEQEDQQLSRHLCTDRNAKTWQASRFHRPTST